MLEYVIFKERGYYKVTSKTNYERRIRNAREVTTVFGASSFKEARDAMPSHYGINYINKTGEV